MGGGLSKDDRRMMVRLRQNAVNQIIRGVPANKVAAAAGVDPSTVFRWVRRFNKGGLAALESSKARGNAPKLSSDQVGRLRQMIVGSDPRQLRFEFALWTRELIGELIEREFGTHMSPSAVGRLLRRIGLSPQRPIWRAYQANPDAVAAWRATEFPAIKAEADKVGALVFFGDEASVRSDYHAGTTWGEIGVTPVVSSTGARYSVNMISAVSPKGKLHFRIVEGKVNADAFIAYCKALADDNRGRPVFLIVDGHPSHRAKKTKEWVRSTEGKFRLFYLPGYSPQLNPDEWVWKNVKADRIGRAGITSLEDLQNKARNALERLARLPELVSAFFRDPNLRYINV